jgi:hypothetical protein
MKEYVLTQPYNSLEEMINSAEVCVYKEELEQGNIEKYAIVSRIGNRYDLDGNKIEDFAKNPFVNLPFIDTPVFTCDKITNEDIVEEAGITIEEFIGVKDMKYPEIERVIDETVAKQVEGVKLVYEEEIAKLKAQHEQEIAELKAFHEDELATVKANAKVEAKEELLAKLNG